MSEQEMKRGAFWSEASFLKGLGDRLDKSDIKDLPQVVLSRGKIFVKWHVWGPNDWDLRGKGISEEAIPDVKRGAIEAEFAKIVDMFPGAVWEKNEPTGSYGETYYELKGAWEDVQIEVLTYRQDVCEAVVVLEHDVVSEVPDPELVAAIPLIKVTEKKKVVEWQCNPVIAEKTDPLFRRIPAEELTA